MSKKEEGRRKKEKQSASIAQGVEELKILTHPTERAKGEC